MAILDKQLEFSAAQALTTGTIGSTNIVDLGSRKPGVSGSMGENTLADVHFTVDTTFVGGTSVQIQMRTSTASNMSSPRTVYSGPAIPIASLTAGARLTPIDFPPDCDRYVDLQYVIVGTFSAGAITARGGSHRHTNY